MVDVAEVILNSRTAGSEACYTYLNSNNAKPGEAYLVPLGTRQAIGYVLKTGQANSESLGFDVNRLRPLGTQICGFELPEGLLSLAHELAKQSFCSLSDVMNLFIPPGLQERLAEQWSVKQYPNGEKISVLESEVLSVIQKEEQWISPKSLKSTDPIARTLQKMRQKGWIVKKLIYQESNSRGVVQDTYSLTQETNVIEEFLKKHAKKKPAQAYALMRLQGSEVASFSLKELRVLTQASDQSLKALIHAGLLVSYSVQSHVTSAPPKLNSYQQQALTCLQSALRAHVAKTFLLYGVTGSGKTEVYLHAAAEALKQGKRVLYLVPEIALTAQVVAKIKDRFGSTVGVLHSHLNPSERLETWAQIQKGDYAILLGARSATFAPLQNIGLIIMDEEHEPSYKQESSPRYHTRDVVERLAQLHQAVVIRGSATPAFESFFAAEKGWIERIDLPNRAVADALPPVHLVDLSELYRAKQPALLSPLLKEKMIETLARKEQIILFLNRRAYAPFIMCRDCGHTYTCQQCSVTLSYHRSKKILKCHHCGHQESVPSACIQCESEKVAPFGVGIEKIEEVVQLEFPEVKVARLDRDIAQRKGALPEIFSQFRNGEIDVLVGTQILAKGLDFPNVTLVGVIAADLSLHLPDFRASERTFQLLAQVAGRAGRGERPGQVVIQTFHPDHLALQSTQNHDYQSFYQQAIQEREVAQYPPFVRLMNVVFSGPDYGAVSQASRDFVAGLMQHNGLQILGPTDCPLMKLHNQWRRHVLLKYDAELDISSLLSRQEWDGVHMVYDVDPYNMM